MKKVASFIFISASLCHTSAFAERSVSMSSHVSTLGLGGSIGVAISEDLEAFGGLNLFDLGFSTNKNELAYKGSLNLQTLLAGARYHPFANGLYVGGGVALNQNKMILKAKPDGDSYRINGTKYNAENLGTVTLNGKFNSLAPLVVIGWESKDLTETGISFFGEVGALLGGAPRFSSDISCNRLSPSSCDSVKENLEAERIAVQDKFKNYWAIPALTIGMKYRFD